MEGKNRKNIQIGSRVEIVQKQHQRSGELTEGIVKRILTKSQNHPHGIKVMVGIWMRHGRPGMEEFWGTTVPYRAYPDNVKDLFQTGKLFENSLTVNGGNENSAISLTVSHTLHDGYVPNTQYERTNVSVGGNTELVNGFTVGGSVSYIRSEQKAVQSGVGNSGANNQSAFARSLYLGRNWDVHGQPYQNPVDFGSEFMVARGQADNPLWSYENVGFRSKVNRVAANVNLGYDFTDWLTVTYKVGVNAYNDRQKDFIRPGSTGPADTPGIGRFTSYDVDWEEIESNFLITFNKDLTDGLNLRAIVGHNFNQRTFEGQAIQGSTYVVFDINDIDNTNDVVPFGGDYTQRRLWGLYADISLGWRDWAFLGLTARNDWSSTLPKENRSYFYPAITASVLLDEALGLQSSFLSSLKVRGAYAEVGSDTDPYLLAPVYLINDTYGIAGVTAALPFTPTGGATVPGASLSNQERDPNLKPERTSEIEGGVDVYFFDNRIGINATYYYRETTDQIAPVTLPVSTGFSSLLTNFGSVSNEGIEIGLDLTPVKLNNGFTWNIFGTFTHNKNKVKELADGVEEITLTGGQFFAGEVSAVLRPGQEYGLLKGSVNARDQEGTLLIDPSNGQMIRAIENAIIGNPNPDFIVGITNTFSWKGLRLSAVFDWRQGGDFFSNTILSMLGRGVTQDTENREMNKIIPGIYGDPNTFEPVLDESGQKIPNQTMVEENSLWFGETFAINAANEWSVYDGTYIRLREITLGYDFPKSLLDSTPFGRASLSLTGRNLWYNAPNVPEHTNFDPEVNQFANSNVQGIEYSATPTTRRFSVNLSLTF